MGMFMTTRRNVLFTLLAGLAVPADGTILKKSAGTKHKKSGKQLNLWAFGDAHVQTNLEHGRQSLAEAIVQSEYGGKDGGPPFDWNIAVNVGDLSGVAAYAGDTEGAEVVRQYGALKKHKREDIYDISGNVDRNGISQFDAWWFQKWIDPLGVNTTYSGVHTANRPYAIEGTWDRYSFRVGNLLFLMMSDRNEPTLTLGPETLGGNPGGVVSGETFRWWKNMVEANPDAIIITAHHYVLKNTTVASGDWEGVTEKADGTYGTNYHTFNPLGTPQGASYLYWVDSKPDSGVFEKYLEEHPGAIAMWLGGHTHTNPDDTYGGKSHIEQKWGVHFINVAGLDRYHAMLRSIPLSRLITFTDESDEVRVQCYLHTSEYAPQGWYPKVERILKINKPFQSPSAELS